MIVKSKTEITIETHRILRINSRGHYLLAWCEECGEQTQVVPEAEAAILTGIMTRAVCLPVRTAEPHTVQTSDGLLVCLNSMMK
jgi:hypothetical protein